MTNLSIVPCARDHLSELIALVDAEGREEYSDDADRPYRVLTAPSVSTLVATAGHRVVGANPSAVRRRDPGAPVLGADWRGGGLGTRLLRDGLSRAGGMQLAIRTVPRLLRATRCEPLTRLSARARRPRAR
jgi:hypothetical protein